MRVKPMKKLLTRVKPYAIMASSRGVKPEPSREAAAVAKPLDKPLAQQSHLNLDN